MKPIFDQTRDELLITASILELRVVIAELEAEQRKAQLLDLGVPPYKSPMQLTPEVLEHARVYTDLKN